ncbi:hypothetical protein [Streptomyces sp. NBC_01207]|uniref:hypothetical protein n=1 Tax=Streptomyces sp. NBC_01207 TaxID=2903772 RepID=UPI002E146099|nr:hypothetical protein OG457_26050 [Streptomyces sp. NBC_01207]
MSLFFTTLLGAFFLVAWLSMAGNGPDKDALSVMAATSGGMAFIRRIAGSRIVLDEKGVSVVNPVFTHDVPYRYVAKVESADGGTLTVTTTQAVEIGALGFAGSLIDHFVGSTDRAVAQINARRAERRDLRGKSPVVRRYTRAWVADICSVAMLVCVVLTVTMGG